MQMQKSFLAIPILMATLLLGCSQAPTADLSATKTALDEARASEADKYAADDFNPAQKAFDDAANEIAAQDKSFFLTRNYSKAQQLLQDAQAKAQTAQTAAKANKEKVKLEVETLTTETEAAIETAQAALAKAPRGKDTQAELAAMKADLDGLTGALAEARDLYSKGDYLGAKAPLTTSKGKAEEVTAEVQTALAKVRGRRQGS